MTREHSVMIPIQLKVSIENLTCAVGKILMPLLIASLLRTGSHKANLETFLPSLLHIVCAESCYYLKVQNDIVCVCMLKYFKEIWQNQTFQFHISTRFLWLIIYHFCWLLSQKFFLWLQQYLMQTANAVKKILFMEKILCVYSVVFYMPL